MGLETRDQKQKLGLLIKISYSPSIPQTIFERILSGFCQKNSPKKAKQAFSTEKDLCKHKQTASVYKSKKFYKNVFVKMILLSTETFRREKSARNTFVSSTREF